MAKYFDKLPQAQWGVTIDNPLTKVLDKAEQGLRHAGSRFTPNAVERRIPPAFKDFAAEMAFSPVGIADPTRNLDIIRAILGADAEVGKQLSQFLLPKTGGPVNLEGLGAELFRPSNLVPVSKAGTLLKYSQRGRPLLAALGREAGVAGAFGAGEALRQEDATPEDVALSAALSSAIGGLTPLGIHGAGRALGKGVVKTAAEEALDEVGGAPPRRRPTRVGRMTVEERLANAEPRTIESFNAMAQKHIKQNNILIERDKARLLQPLTDRPEGKKGGLYADDILTVDGNRYTTRLLQADAGETVDKPFIEPGSHALPSSKRTGTERRVSLSIQEAEILRELYDDYDDPTPTQIKEALKLVQGRAPKRGEISEADQIRLQEARLVVKEAKEAGDDVATKQAQQALKNVESEVEATRPIDGKPQQPKLITPDEAIERASAFNHTKEDLQRVASGEGTITLYHGTPERNARGIQKIGVQLPKSGTEALAEVAELYGLDTKKLTRFIGLEGGGYGEETAKLSTASAKIAARWAGHFPYGEVYGQLNENARLYAELQKRGWTKGKGFDRLWEEAEKKVGRKLKFGEVADALGLPDQLKRSKTGMILAIEVPTSKLPENIRKEAASLLSHKDDEELLHWWNDVYRDIKIAPSDVVQVRPVMGNIGYEDTLRKAAAKEVPVVTNERVKAVKDYIDKVATRSSRPIRRPLPQDTPALRASTRSLRAINDEVISTGIQLENLEHTIAKERGVTPDLDEKELERSARNKLKAHAIQLSKQAEDLPLNSQKKQALLNEIVQIDDIINGKTPLPEELLEEVRVRTPKPRTEAAQARLAKAEEEWRNLTERREFLLKQRAAELEMAQADVPLDPNEQVKILINKHGAVTDGQPPVLPPSRANEVLTQYREAEADAIAGANDRISNKTAQSNSIQALLDAIDQGRTGRRVPASGNMQEAGRLLAKHKELEDLIAQNPNGFSQATTASESLSNYARVALMKSYHEALSSGTSGDALISMLRNLPRHLMGVGDRVDGPGGRVFVEVDGERHYGSIKGIKPIGGDYNNWAIDFVPEFTASRSVIPGLTVKDVGVEYKKKVPKAGAPRRKGDDFDAIDRRYKDEINALSALRDEEGTGVFRGTPEALDRAKRATQLVQREMPLIEPLRISTADNRTIEDLQAEKDALWDEFLGTMLPLEPGELSDPTAQARLARLGFIDMRNSPLPKGKAKSREALRARNNMAKDYQQYLMETSGLALDDPDMTELFDAGGSPIDFAMYLRGRSLDPEDIVRESTVTNILPRRVRGALDYMLGRGFADMRVRGIFTGYQYARKGVAANIWRNFNGVTIQLRRLAVEDFAKVSDTRAAMRPKAARFAHGDIELEAVLNQHYNPQPRDDMSPDLKAALARIETLPDDVQDALHDYISRQHRFLMDYPELFPTIPKGYTDIARFGRAQVDILSDIAAADGSASVSQGYLNRLMLDPIMRTQVPPELLDHGHPLSVLAATASISHDMGKPLSEMLVRGDDLLRAEPLAHWNSSLMNRIKIQVSKLVDPEQKFSDDDIVHTAGQWRIRGLDKWKVRDEDGGIIGEATKDLQNSLKQLEEGLNRSPNWKGLQGLSQSIAQSVLTLDANVVSVQGYAAISSKALMELARTAGGRNRGGARAMGEYLSGLQSLASDEGFHAWYRTNADEIQYYSSLGMSIGMESFIAGPRQNRLPLENMPFFGKLPKTAREFNDLQFNRILLYLKVNSVRNMTEKARIGRKLGPTSGQFFFSGLPGIKSVVDEAAGVSPYLYGQPEHVIKASIRATNNKLGGIDLNAQGIVQWRQTAEQIMSITPGFLRAQAGMFNTALTRPHSVEGWMAITGIAEEVMFAAGVASLIALATGNSDKMNYTDITKADWMAVPFDDSYIPIIPRVALPRLAARLLGNIVDAAQGEGWDGNKALQSFAQGRLSPLVNATLGPVFFDEDFLGRKYRDKKDRAFASLTSFMPIFLENIATDAREGMAQDGWAALTPLTYQTPLQFLGKSIVPRPPIDKMDEIAMQYSSQQPGGVNRGWFDLTKPEQEQLLLNPKTKAAFDDFTYHQERRQSPKEQQIEAQFRMSEERVDALRTKPVRFPDGTTMSMTDAYQLLLAGEIDGDAYRDKLQYVNGRISERMESMEVSLKNLGVDLEDKSAERQKRLREVFKGADENAILTQLAVWDTQMVQPENYTTETTVQTANGEVKFMETDWDAYQTDRDATLEQYSDTVRLNALNLMDKWEDEGVGAYRAASKQRQLIEELPRYRGLDNDQADKVDAMTKSFRDLNDLVRAKIGIPGSFAPLPAGMGKALRAYALQQFVAEGFLQTRDDVKLASLAIMMQDDPKLREVMRGQEQLEALLNNPDVVRFYPYLMSRIPTWARGQLPPELQPQFDIQNRYADLAG